MVLLTTHFRMKEYLMKGFAMNDGRLKNLQKVFRGDYFE